MKHVRDEYRAPWLSLGNMLRVLIFRGTGVHLQWYTPSAHQVLNLAFEEADCSASSKVASTHLMLALAREPDGLASTVLAAFGIDTGKLGKLFDGALNEDADRSGKLTKQAGQALVNAFEQAESLRQRQIGTAQLLLGVLANRRAVATKVLASAGFEFAAVRRHVEKLLDEHHRDGGRLSQWADLQLEKVSETAELALRTATAEALASRSETVTGEHVFLGLLAQPDCDGAQFLQRLGLTDSALRRRLSLGPAPEGTVPYLSRSIDIAFRSTLQPDQKGTSIGSLALARVVLKAGSRASELLTVPSIETALELIDGSAMVWRAEPLLNGYCPELRLLWSDRSVARIRTGRYAEARSDLMLLLTNAMTSQQRAISANNLAWVDLLVGDDDGKAEALHLAQEATAAWPESSALRNTLGWALIENGRDRDGVEILEPQETREADAHDAAELTAALAIGKWRLGRKGPARALLEQAARLDPNCAVLPRARQIIRSDGS